MDIRVYTFNGNSHWFASL